MRLTIISPLFPPDTAPPAVYTKVLLSKIVSPTTTVTSIIYGQMPETVTGVTILTVPKRHNVWWRLIKMFAAIRTQTSITDIFVLSNGPSIEIPFLLAMLLTPKKYIFIINDCSAAIATEQSWWKNKLHQKLKQNALHTFVIGSDILKYCPPEIHPLLPHPHEALQKFTKLWETHQTEILKLVYDKQ